MVIVQFVFPFQLAEVFIFFFHFELVHLISLFKYSLTEFYFWFLFHSQWATHKFLSS